MAKGDSRSTRPPSQPFTPSRKSYRNTAMPVRLCSHGAGFSLDGPHQQPSAGVGSRGRSPWLEAKDEAIACIPMPFGLKRLGGDPSKTGSYDGGHTEPRYTPTTAQQPTAQRPSQAPEPFKPSGDNSRQEAGSGLEGRTTVMIRRTPPNLTQRNLAWELNTAGFAGLYDYVYIPVDRRLLARPMAFVNFTSGEAAERFFQAFNGRPLQSCGSVEPVFVIPASVQGVAQNIAHHLACMKKNPGGRRECELGPLFHI